MSGEWMCVTYSRAEGWPHDVSGREKGENSRYKNRSSDWLFSKENSRHNHLVCVWCYNVSPRVIRMCVFVRGWGGGVGGVRLSSLVLSHCACVTYTFSNMLLRNDVVRQILDHMCHCTV